MMKQLKRLLIILMLIVPMAVAAVYLFKTLDTRDGLTSSQINCILKDSRGYMWFGTPAGLYRYDGYTFKNFQSDSRDGSSLPDGCIYDIQEALDGSLWIKTAAGLCLYHPQTESFERDMHQVYTRMGLEDDPTWVYIDSHKNLWMYVPGKGVMAYNTQQQTLFEFGYTDDARGIPEGDICSIGECRDGAVLVYSNGELVCCDVMHQQRTVWRTDEIAVKKLRHTNTLHVFADQMDNIWLYGQGTLMVYYKNKNTWNTTIGNSLGMTGANTDHSVNGVVGDRKGNIWIGTDRDGLLRCSISSPAMESVIPRNINDQQRMQDVVPVQCLYIDDTDLLWVGTVKSGVAYSGDNIYKFGSTLMGDVTAITQDKSGKMWYGTSDRGIMGYSGPLASQAVTCMQYTPDGSLWVGSKQNGLTRIWGKYTHLYSTTTDSMNTIIDDHINALCTDKIGNLWIASNGGLQVYNPRMNSFSSYTKENDRLKTNNVTSLFYGKNNTMYVGTNEGLTIINLSTTDRQILTGNVSNLKSFTNNYVTQVLQDSRGLLWIGTREGVNVLNMENDSLDYLTENEGLCNNNICGLVEDKHHNIWISTSDGVCRVVIQRNHEDGTFNYGIYNYSTADGLQSNEFNPGAIYNNSRGDVVLGGIFGVNWVKTDEKWENASLPKVMLTQLFFGQQEVLVGHEYNGRVPLPQALNESQKIELSHSQNTFTIKFAAGNYNQNERLQFMYWLEGKDDTWRNGDAINHGVTFHSLSSGSYTLHVKAINANGAISNQERTLDITILRPWWASWWMLAIYVIIIIVSVYFWKIGWDKLKRFINKKKTILKELIYQRDQIKLASDDLRQPMVRMTSIIGDMTEREKTVEGKENINSLHAQMLQVITRLAEMQSALENPVEEAENTATKRLELNDNGEVNLSEMIANQELAIDYKPRQSQNLITQKYTIAIIDDNTQFLKFIMARLQDIYDMHSYSDILVAKDDIEVLKPNIVVCKQDMPKMTGSELCNDLKSNMRTQNIKFVIMTDGVLSAQDMTQMNITLSADDYLSKPFNIQEAMMRFNKLLGLATMESVSDAIEGRETRSIEGRNASMTTASMSYNMLDDNTDADEEDVQQNNVTDEKETEKKTEAKTDEPKSQKVDVPIHPTDQTSANTTIPTEEPFIEEPVADTETSDNATSAAATSTTYTGASTSESPTETISEPAHAKEQISEEQIAQEQKAETPKTEDPEIVEAIEIDDEAIELARAQAKAKMYQEYAEAEPQQKNDTQTQYQQNQQPQQADQSQQPTGQVPQQATPYYQAGETVGDYTMASTVDNRLLLNIEQYVLQNMARGQISVEEMSQVMGMGRVPFFHKIKAITHKTPSELVREIRLKHACTLLEKTDINLNELAQNVGLFTAENFIKAFREKYGMSPIEYRMKSRRVN